MRNYTTIQGDTWDIISKKVYGSEKHGDVLLEQNWPERSRVIFPAGIVLGVPDISTETVDSSDLPPWRR
jgi:phage tail protein X